MSPKNEALIRRMRRLVYADLAFGSVISMCEFLQTHEPDKNKLWQLTAVTGLVTEYMRPFTEGNGVGALPKEYSEFSDPAMRELHQHLQYGRHWICAHHDMINSVELLAENDRALHGKVRVRVYEPGNRVECATAPIRFVWGRFPAVIALCREQGRRLSDDKTKTLSELMGYKPYPPGEYFLGEDFP